MEAGCFRLGGSVPSTHLSVRDSYITYLAIPKQLETTLFLTIFFSFYIP